jgi:hypothetical protein
MLELRYRISRLKLPHVTRSYDTLKSICKYLSRIAAGRDRREKGTLCFVDVSSWLKCKATNRASVEVQIQFRFLYTLVVTYALDDLLLLLRRREEPLLIEFFFFKVPCLEGADVMGVSPPADMMEFDMGPSMILLPRSLASKVSLNLP